MASDDKTHSTREKKRDLMFINGTVAPDRGIVRSHVLRQYWESKKQTSRQKSKSTKDSVPRQRQVLPRLPGPPTHSEKGLLDDKRTPIKKKHLSTCNISQVQTISVKCDNRTSQSPCRAVGCHFAANGSLLCQTHADWYNMPSFDRNSPVVSWRFDPFLNFPVELTPDIKETLDYAFTDHRPNIVFYRNVQLPNALMCAASFHQVVANILKWMRLSDTAEVPGNNRRNQEFRHQVKAVGLINNMIATGSINEGLVSAANLLAYVHLMEGEVELNIHRQALAEVVRLVGSTSNLKPDLGAFLFWIDVNVSCTLDLKPMFSPPPHLSTSILSYYAYPRGTFGVVELWSGITPEDSDIIDLFCQVATFSIQLNADMANANTSQHLHWANQQGILCHGVLNSQRSGSTQDSRPAIREACRLAVLLFLVPVRRLLAVTCYSTVLQLDKLQTILFDRKVDWGGLELLKQWIIAMAMLEASDKKDVLKWARLWLAHNVTLDFTASELPRSVTDIMWVKSVHGKRFEKLRGMLRELDSGVDESYKFKHGQNDGLGESYFGWGNVAHAANSEEIGTLQ